MMAVSLLHRSEYLHGLSAQVRARYDSKVLCTGLDIDPYTIEDAKWSQEPQTIPSLGWSDVCLYMTCTPSPYTKEALKVCVMPVV